MTISIQRGTHKHSQAITDTTHPQTDAHMHTDTHTHTCTHTHAHTHGAHTHTRTHTPHTHTHTSTAHGPLVSIWSTDTGLLK